MSSVMKIYQCNFILLLLCTMIITNASAQVCLSINEIIDLYEQKNTPYETIKRKHQIANLQRQNNLATWQWQSKIGLDMPYNKSIESIIKDDGTTAYLQREFLNPQFNITTSRKLLHTGGEIGLQNNIGLLNNLAIGDRQYNSNWFNIYFSQPLFGYNTNKFNFEKNKYQYKIDSLRYTKEKVTALKKFVTDVLELQILQATENMLLQKEDFLKLQHATLIQLYTAGKILPTDTFETFIELGNTNLALMQIEDNMQMQRLFLSNINSVFIDFSVCDFSDAKILLFTADGIKNKYVVCNYNKELILDSFIAMQNIKQNKMANGIITTINAGVGVNKTTTEAKNIFSSPSQRQNVSINTSVPITGWKTYQRNNTIGVLEKEIFEQNKHLILQEATKWSAMQVNNYYYLLMNINNSKKNISLQTELLRIASLKLQAGKILFYDLNKILVDKINQEIKLMELKKQIHLFRFELLENTLVDWGK